MGGCRVKLLDFGIAKLLDTDLASPATRTGTGARPAGLSGDGERLHGELRRGLVGDLDAVVLKALRREPEARYATVAQLADDLRRHAMFELPGGRGLAYDPAMRVGWRRRVAGRPT